LAIIYDPNPNDGNCTLTAVSGKTTFFPFRAPRRGMISRLRVIQLSGTLAGFTFAVFKRYDAARVQDDNTTPPYLNHLTSFSGGPGGLIYTDAAFPATGSSNMYLAYQITPTRTVGTVAHDDPAGFDLSIGYTNQDAAIGVGNVDRLYLVIKPAGSGDKDFVVDICVETPPNL